jgi:iron complex transport system ATP-binding protein
MNNIIEVKNLSFGYTNKAILENLSLEVKQGIFVGIIGPNGAGKTTLLNLLCGLLKPKAGAIKLDAADIESFTVKEVAKKIAVVRQEFVPVFDFTVAQTVSMARTPYLGTFGFMGKTDWQIVNDALEATDTSQFASRALGNLSGGERQRVFIARALAQKTPILLLDEPTSFLDLKHQVNIYDLLKAAQLEQGKTIIAVTHDINLAAQYCDVILLLGPGSSYRYGCTKDVLSIEQITKVFGVEIYSGKVDQEHFFIPLGKLAKDREKANKMQEKL